jgi:hypothetical protein
LKGSTKVGEGQKTNFLTAGLPAYVDILSSITKFVVATREKRGGALFENISHLSELRKPNII